MSSKDYAIIYNDESVEEFTTETVKAQLTKLLKVEANKDAAFFRKANRPEEDHRHDQN